MLLIKQRSEVTYNTRPKHSCNRSQGDPHVNSPTFPTSLQPVIT